MSESNEKYRASGDVGLPALLSHGLVEQLMDLVVDGIVVHGGDRRIFLVNRALEEITGLARESMMGADCHEVFGSAGLCGGACAFQTVQGAQTQNVFREHEQVFVCPDGRVLRLHIRATPLPVGNGQNGVLAIVRDVTELSHMRAALELTRHLEFHGMIGVSSAISEAFELLRAVGPSDYPVLITGESGTGKELAARAIHLESMRSSGPFVPINCGALPENILESELFGHVRGAFTGAIQDKKGRFELANGGTLFLDEVGELPLHMQVKLLRVLQERTFERVGGERPLMADVRIVAASNRDLRKMVAEGTFREDLFYRLCVVPVELPALRDRPEDIPPIVRRILEKVAAETGRSGLSIDDDAMTAIRAHSWPGNVRELINAIQYASVRCGAGVIRLEHLPYEVRVPHQSVSAVYRSSAPPPATRIGAAEPAAAIEVRPAEVKSTSSATRPRAHLTAERVNDALVRARGNRRNAAKLLGVGRATLYRFFEAHPELDRD